MEILLALISTVLGCTTFWGFLLYGKANRRIKEAEAEKTEAEANEAEDHRFDNLLKLVDSLTSRLSSLNATVDKHIDRNRELSDRLYKSETELNRANERIIKLTEEKEAERSLKEHYKMWHCRKEGCADRLPPNEKLKGMKYEHPKRAVK